MFATVIEWTKVIQVWLVIGQWIIIAVVVTTLDWKKYMKFFQKETPESIEQKLYGFDESVNAIITADEDGIVSSVNREAEVLFGYSEKFMRGRNLNSIIPERLRKAHNEGLRAAKGKVMEAKKVRLDALRNDGTEFPIELILRKKNADANPFYLAIIRDRTDEINIAENLFITLTCSHSPCC